MADFQLGTTLSKEYPYLSTCWNCRGFITQLYLLLKDIERGRTAECGICTLVSRGLTAIGNSLGETDIKKYNALKLVRFIGLERQMCVLELGNDESNSKMNTTLRLRLWEDVIDQIVPETLEFPGPVPAALELDRAALCTRSRIENCARCHPDCTTRTTTALPKRVLDISSKSQSHIKLLQTSGESVPYAALSYCWGRYIELNLRTTTATLKQGLERIYWEALPLCFQDAILLCWRLQIDYLWIDSLCILQDSLEDWEAESAKMAAIYSGSLLTIAASSAADPSQSLFADRWVGDVSLSGNQGLGLRMKTDTVSVIQHEGHVFHFTPSNYRIHRNVIQLDQNDDLDEIEAPLSTRAWAFQERLLSPFTLHFHSSEMVWECRTSTQCECGLVDDDRERPSYSATRDRLKFSKGFAEMPGSDLLKVQNIWQHQISVYSGLRLTHESDRLAALSGLAAQVRHPAFGHYVAGIWTGMLPAAFLYYITREDAVTLPTKKEPRDSDALRSKGPSWSWVSIPLDCNVAVNYDLSTRLGIRRTCSKFKVLNTVYTLLSRNPYGWVENAKLTVLGRCIEHCTLTRARELHLIQEQHGTEGLVSRMVLLDVNAPYLNDTDVMFLHIGSEFGLSLEKVSSDHLSAYKRLGIVLLDSDKKESWESHMVCREVDLV